MKILFSAVLLVAWAVPAWAQDVDPDPGDCDPGLGLSHTTKPCRYSPMLEPEIQKVPGGYEADVPGVPGSRSFPTLLARTF